MCGIAGIRRFGPEPITEEQISVLLCANERRGNHATGLALQNPDGQVHVLKQDEPAWKFVTSKEYDAFIAEHLNDETLIFLGHTRAATQGSPTKNENNHPVFAGDVAVTHNGMIQNDDSLFKELKLERKAEVDSDILRAILDEKGLTKEGIKFLKKISGSAAFAAVSCKYPGRLMLGRSGSPLVMASTPDQLVWASEKSAIHAAMRPFLVRFGFYMQPNRADLAFTTMNNDSIYLLGDLIDRHREGENPYFSPVEWHEKFDTARWYNPPTYDIHGRYRNHRGRFYGGDNTEVLPAVKEKPKMVWCRECKKWLTVSKANKDTPLYLLRCDHCKTWCSDPPVTDEEETYESTM